MLDKNVVYLITGANRGIGLEITTHLLLRPNTTVIATSRTPCSTLTTLSHHPTSTIYPLLLDEADQAINHASLPSRLPPSITHIDTVIANAGSSVAFKSVVDTTPEEILADMAVNSLGPVRLFAAVRGLLLSDGSGGGSQDNNSEGKRREKKFVLISSSVASIGLLEMENAPGVGYGMSKVAANWFAKKVAAEFKGVGGFLVGVVHPGWVKTAMGQAFADAVGFPEPPMSVKDSAEAVIEQIDNLTPEKSGQFLNYNGDVIPW